MRAGVLLLCWCLRASRAVPPATLTLGALHPGTDPDGWPAGNAIQAGLQTAVNLINADTSVLAYTTLQLHMGDTRCQTGQGQIAMIDMIDANYVGILGTGCSYVALTVATAFAATSVPMVSYANTHPELSDKTKYPWYLRTSHNDGLGGRASASFISTMGWTKAATISDLQWFGVTTTFLTAATQLDMHVLTQIVVMDVKSTAAKMRQMKSTGAKIFFGMGYGDFMRALLDTRDDSTVALFDTGYAWLTNKWVLDGLYGDIANDVARLAAIAGWIAVGPRLNTTCYGTRMKNSACTENSAYSTFVNKMRTDYPNLTESDWSTTAETVPSILDSVLVFANALDSVFNSGASIGDATFQSSLRTALINIEQLNVPGVQIPILKFDVNHDFAHEYTVYNYVDVQGTAQEVGIVGADGVMHLSARNRAGLVWPAYDTVSKITTVVPRDQEQTSNDSVILVMYIFGGCLGTIFLAFIIYVGFKLVRKFTIDSRRLEEAQDQRIFESVKKMAECEFPLCVMGYYDFLEMGSLMKHEHCLQTGRLHFLHTIGQTQVFTAKYTVVFISHQWLGWSEPDKSGVHYEATKKALQELTRTRDLDPLLCYVWMDYFSIPQDNRLQQSSAISTIGTYTQCSKYLIAIVVPTLHHDAVDIVTDACLKCNLETYKNRGWCRLEQWAHLICHGMQNTLCFDGTLHQFDVGSISDPTSFFNQVIEVFAGNFTCCDKTANHTSTLEVLPCDKDKIVDTVLGLWGAALIRKNEAAQQVKEVIITDHLRVFPYRYFKLATTQMLHLRVSANDDTLAIRLAATVASASKSYQLSCGDDFESSAAARRSSRRNQVDPHERWFPVFTQLQASDDSLGNEADGLLSRMKSADSGLAFHRAGLTMQKLGSKVSTRSVPNSRLEPLSRVEKVTPIEGSHDIEDASVAVGMGS